jgi:hypothetical protein
MRSKVGGPLVLTLWTLCACPSNAADDPVAFLSGHLGGVAVSGYETPELNLRRGFTIGFGGSLGIRVINAT